MSKTSARTGANRSSVRNAVAHRRKGFTGETFEAALAGIGRQDAIGLDACSPGQRSFRALLALGLFNEGLAAALPGTWGSARLSTYDPVMSPRWGALVMIVERAPDNVTDLLVPDEHQKGVWSVPGLRLLAYTTRGAGTYHLQHEPTGARLVVTGNPGGPQPVRGCAVAPWRDARRVGDPLTGAERRALDGLPAMTPDAEVLLAGLVSRCALEDRQERWATSWSWDPLGRLGLSEELRRSRHGERRLWGGRNTWELTWSGYPWPADLARALTHPVVGVTGATLHQHRGTCEVTYGSAVLTIREWLV
ncbi:hypothetical protein [Streptomyces sp. NPDC020362]|uniref:hypothetical protein n=1 Tax=unclassified Streptomyces TaxID=2593676 RepID=UPI000A557707